jgi:acetyltransferase-like isoleucine patch superfamily enzyme
VSTSPVFYDNTQPLPIFFTKRKNFNNIFSKTIIGSDVWIGVDVKIKSGLNIGTGAVIGAGAVVTKDVPAYSVVVGVPAKHLKFRFKEEIIEQLLHSKWWEFSDNKLERLAPYFENPDGFFRELSRVD